MSKRPAHVIAVWILANESLCNGAPLADMREFVSSELAECSVEDRDAILQALEGNHRKLIELRGRR